MINVNYKMSYSLIVACQKNRVIGKDSKQHIPWENDTSVHSDLVTDRKFFREKTKGNIVVMGRKTFESIGKVLPDRTNIILSTSDIKISPENISGVSFEESSKVFFVKSMKDAVNICDSYKDKEVFIIGGETIYKQALDFGLVNKVYLTVLDTNYDGDTFYTGPMSGCNETLIHSTDNMKITSFTLPNSNLEETSLLNLIGRVITDGKYREDRTDAGSYYIIGGQLRFSLRNNRFPLLTTKSQPLKDIFNELMWFLSGSTNTKDLSNKGTKVWDYNSTKEFITKAGLDYKEGDIGPSYGHQMRHYGAEYKDFDTNYENKGIDQLAILIDNIKNIKERKDKKRRLIIDLYNPAQVNEMVLPPCMCLYQFFVEGDMLSCYVYQRSSDIVVAGGWNIATASLFTILLAKTCNLYPDELVWSPSDIHIYSNNKQAAEELISRAPRKFPELYIDCSKDIDKYIFEDLHLVNYFPNRRLKTVLN